MPQDACSNNIHELHCAEQARSIPYVDNSSEHAFYSVIQQLCGWPEEYLKIMAGGIDKGLSSSRWATGHPYHFNKKTNQTTTTTLSSTHTTYKTSHTETLTSTTPTNTSSSAYRSASVTNGTIPSSSGAAPYQLDFRSALNRIPTPWAELARYTKIVRRLKWKLPFLAYAYNAAIDRTITDEQRGEAELMFKLDFFEYYMLVERALVHLLGVFGIQVTGALATRVGNGHGDHRLPGRTTQEGWEQSDHRFHANVLEALDDDRNPLHEALGKDDARFSLARAKECETAASSDL